MVIYWSEAIAFPKECNEIKHVIFDEWYHQFIQRNNNTLPEVEEEVLNEIDDKLE